MIISIFRTTVERYTRHSSITFPAITATAAGRQPRHQDHDGTAFCIIFINVLTRINFINVLTTITFNNILTSIVSIFIMAIKPSPPTSSWKLKKLPTIGTSRKRGFHRDRLDLNLRKVNQIFPNLTSSQNVGQ